MVEIATRIIPTTGLAHGLVKKLLSRSPYLKKLSGTKLTITLKNKRRWLQTLAVFIKKSLISQTFNDKKSQIDAVAQQSVCQDIRVQSVWTTYNCLKRQHSRELWHKLIRHSI